VQVKKEREREEIIMGRRPELQIHVFSWRVFIFHGVFWKKEEF
jgi:hypothetical protein